EKWRAGAAPARSGCPVMRAVSASACADYSTTKLTRMLTRHSATLPSGWQMTFISLTHAPFRFLTLPATFFSPPETASSKPLVELDDTSMNLATCAMAVLLRIGRVVARHRSLRRPSGKSTVAGSEAGRGSPGGERGAPARPAIRRHSGRRRSQRRLRRGGQALRPATGQGGVQRHQRGGLAGLRLRQPILGLELRAFGVEHGEEIDDAGLEPQTRQLRGAGAGDRGMGQ